MNDIDKKFLDEAFEWVGTPRMDGQATKGVGCDCVGLLIGIAKEIRYLPFDYKEPNYYQIARGDSLPSILRKHLQEIPRHKEEVEPGDIVVLEYSKQLTHVGIVYFDNHLIHSHHRKGVKMVFMDRFLREKIKQVYKLWAN